MCLYHLYKFPRPSSAVKASVQQKTARPEEENKRLCSASLTRHTHALMVLSIIIRKCEMLFFPGLLFLSLFFPSTSSPPPSQFRLLRLLLLSLFLFLLLIPYHSYIFLFYVHTLSPYIIIFF